MGNGTSLLHQIYFKLTGYSFTHMGRLFLRLFIGLMVAQFGVRQLCGSDATGIGLEIPYVSSGLSEWLVIVVEIICPFFIMIGLFTRAMILPPFVLMIVACHEICLEYGFRNMEYVEILTIPFLFLGVFMFILLCGPGKISFDYFYSLYLINRHKGEERDLEEV